MTCVWPVDTACFTDEWDGFDDAVQARALLLASATLERLTGHRVGNCPITVRPCVRGCQPAPMFDLGYHTSIMYPHLNVYGNWVNACGCTTDCGCTALCEVILPGPVGRIDSVKIDGVVLNPIAYRVDGNRLVWVGDGECLWPTCQDLRLPDTEVNTFSVTYLNAYPVDDLGKYAVAILANEYARACSGGACRLPAGVTMIVRQGISMEITSGAFPDGMTGIREVDAYIALWNPRGLTQGATVWSPGIPRTRLTTVRLTP